MNKIKGLLLLIIAIVFTFCQSSKYVSVEEDSSANSEKKRVFTENIKWNSLKQPVFSDPDDDFAKDPSIFYADGKYYMYYTGSATGFQGHGTPNWQIEYATSSDGLNWKKQGVIFKADSNTWEAGRVQAPSRPIWYDGKYYMFYTGGPRKPKNLIYTSYATSTDLVNWTKSNEIIPQNIGRANDIFIYEEEDIFYMFYTTYKEKNEPIFMRKSSDLVNWSEPEPTGAGGEGSVLWKEKGRYYMLGCHGWSSTTEVYRYMFQLS
ncbi:family 43 glycosylhydrolase [Reichenbachiella sp. MALMAid0571]|uniref:glycoside hydrolase family 130 protein n=1 Tax=Reichenbachiella sp. MALMAid0571 TaxID=3143939 RepID=UPI0032E05532